MTEHAHPTVKTFVSVWVALLVLTAITVFVATLDLGPFNAIVALTIATIKALLVLLFFMELRYSTALTKVAVIAAVFFFFLLAGLTLSDYMTRGWSSYINPFH
jgi:cytochrome c oxidase subunit 4